MLTRLLAAVLSTVRPFAFTVLLFVSPLLLVSGSARAQDANPEEGNTPYQFEGVINANSVYVHSGATENDYPTMKLDRGAHVKVVGIRFDWLKIIPPEGSFCYIAKAYTEKRGDGSIGRTTNALNVHIGSELNTLKIKVVKRLDADTDVQIIGEQDEYFKIKPPEGVYLYVDKQFVDPVRQIVVNSPASGASAGDASSLPAPDANSPLNPAATPAPAAATSATPDASMTTNTASSQPAVASAAPATQPADAVADAQAAFDHLEATFATESGRPLEDQDPATLSAGYDKLAKGGALPDSLRRIAEYKAAVLKARADDRTQYLAVKKEQDEMKARVAALRAEREELETRVKQSEIKAYAAVGTLRPSSLQQGTQTLYRLTDPSTGRTVIYVRSDDAKLGALMNQFIGVKGTITDDQQLNLKFVAPTDAEPVDQSKLYTGVMAQIVPPSLMPAGQASSGN
jgi:hypothetical protein